MMFDIFRFVERIDDDVGGQSILRRTDGPDMQMMQLYDPGIAKQCFLYIFGIDTCGNTVERQPYAVMEQVPCRDENDSGNNQSDNRVDNKPAGMCNDDAREKYAYTYERIGGHVQECSFYIQVVSSVFEKEPGRESVDEDTDTGYPCDCPSFDRLRMSEFFDAFGNNETYGDQQDNGIE